MEGIYPIIIDGVEMGSCTVRREGGYTVFSLDCGMVEGVIRLSAYGGGREGYLGVPVPRNGRLRLEKKLSPSALRSFPEAIDCVSLAGGMAMEEAVPTMEKLPEEKPEPEMPEEPEEEKPEMEKPEMEKPCEEPCREEEEKKPCGEPCREEEECRDICGEEKEEKPCDEKHEDKCEEPCEAEEDGPFWYASADGALVSFDGERELVALPVDDGRVPKNIPGQPRVIEGKEYLVYISKMTMD